MVKTRPAISAELTKIGGKPAAFGFAHGPQMPRNIAAAAQWQTVLTSCADQ